MRSILSIIAALSLLGGLMATTPTPAPPRATAATAARRPAGDSLAHFREAMAGERPLTIVALGDSVTELNWTTRGHLNWVGLLSASLFESKAARGYAVINAGISGSTFTDGLARVDRDVLRHDPDLVIIGFGINDWMFAHNPPEQQRRDLVALIEHIRAASDTSILLRTPHTIVDKETFAWTEPEEMRVAVAMIREVAAEQGVTLVDHHASWLADPPDARATMYDWIHPNEVGHLRFFNEIAPVLGLKTQLRWMKE